MSKTQPSLLSRLNPRRRDSRDASPTPTPPDTADTVSKTASSCEIFAVFKALAAKPAPIQEPLPTLSLDSLAADLPSPASTLLPDSIFDDKDYIMSPPIESASLYDNITSSAEKIAAIQEEYGLPTGENVERMLVESEGTMYKGIMLIGNIHLTTHRLLFHALLPPDEAYIRHYDSEFEPLGVINKSHLVHSGPVTWHRHKALNPSQRVWMELTAEGISLYPSADESGRMRPIKSILLSSVDSLQPANPAKPSDLHLSFRFENTIKTYDLTVDTVEAAAQWRRHIKAALFRTLRVKWRNTALTKAGKEPATGVDQWDTLRYCVPLDRVTITEIGDYHGFATLVGLRIALRQSERVLTHSDLTGTDDFSAPHPGQPEEHDLTFNLGVISHKHHFVEQLTLAVQSAKPSGTPMSFSIGGIDLLANEDDIVESVDEPRPSESLSAKVARKAATAHMAAVALGLDEAEGIWIKRCYIDINNVPIRGHLVVSPRYICFWRRNNIAEDVKYRFESSLVQGFETTNCIQPGFSGLALHLHGRRDVMFEFWNKHSRDEVMTRLSSCVTQPQTPPSKASTPSENHPADILAPSKAELLATRVLPDDFLRHMPFVANKPWSQTVGMSPRTFALLTIGSRGDVQPYIALGVRLKRDGHRVIIVTHAEFKGWIEGYDLEHRQAGGDPTALMKLSQEHKMLSPGFFKESVGYFRNWLDDLLVDAWEACKDADVLIESPSAMAGIHIAEALKIPYFRAFTMPWTRTHDYPQAFMVPAIEMGESFNYSTYVIYDNVIWKATAGQVNRWRKKHLQLAPTDMSALSPTKVPFLYNFSEAVVPRPLDWHSDIAITGYWVLENSDSEWTPPAELEAFMENTDKPLVYIGFGSIVVSKPNELTRSIVEAVNKANVKAIIAKGWSSRSSDSSEAVGNSENCFFVDKVPHGWLFPKVQAALHHGGAGTVGASLRAGLPTLISPWFGDQFFWANRVTKLGVGLKVTSLRANDIADALVKATTDRIMREKASRIGDAIRKESGVDNAVDAITHYIVRAGEDRTKLAWGH